MTSRLLFHDFLVYFIIMVHLYSLFSDSMFYSPQPRRLCFHPCPFLCLIVCQKLNYSHDYWKYFHVTWPKDGTRAKREPIQCWHKPRQRRGSTNSFNFNSLIECVGPRRRHVSTECYSYSKINVSTTAVFFNVWSPLSYDQWDSRLPTHICHIKNLPAAQMPRSSTFLVGIMI